VPEASRSANVRVTRRDTPETADHFNGLRLGQTPQPRSIPPTERLDAVAGGRQLRGTGARSRTP